MFTGIIREKSTINQKRQSKEGAEFEVGSGKIAQELEIGGSISIDGCCLTVTELESNYFKVTATPETLRLTNLGDRRPGDQVNLELAARLSDFLGGHLVQGHVDETGELSSITQEGNSMIFRFHASGQILRYCVLKGSIAVNGVSLTVSNLNSDSFEVTIIPHTYEVTNFSSLKVGDRVNLEADIISKYVESHVRRS
ncbi:MAG: riboflavin synthase [Acidobacteriota bacterium]